MSILKIFEIHFYVSLKFAQHVITSLFSQHLSFVSSWIKLKFYLEFYYALPCIRLNGVLHLFHLFVYTFKFWFFCFSAIKTISMRNLPWECVSMLVGWLQTWCSNNVLKMRLSLSSVPVAMEEFRTPILSHIPGVNISKMLELSTRLEEHFESMQLQSLFLVNLFMYW